ncbi:hypothetical protein JXD38_08965 [candidate division WOR-3 bacterium]|nr:hypothetical protein [candidate division WOR-3 bacterium]
MKSVLFAAAVIALAAQSALAGKQIFVSSADYDITVQLSYTRDVSPEGEQGGFSSYTSTGEFQHVRFGPSPSKDFEAWFERRLAANAAVPMRQISGEGRVGPFVIAPAWEDPSEPIEPRITAGPLPFVPTLEVITFQMAHAEDEESMPVVPLAPTVWLRYNESFSIDEPELKWEYPKFALGQVESDGVLFSVPTASLAKGEDLEINVPYENGAARGEWKIVFWANEGQENKWPASLN